MIAKEKNIYGVGIIILVALLVVSNVTHIVRYNSAAEEHEDDRSALITQLAIIGAIELIEIDPFVNELDWAYIHILTMEPVGFIGYSSDYMEFRTVMYNATFDIITEEEANGSVEVWLRNYTYDAFMTFDVAVANNQDPMRVGNIYKFYYIYNAYQFFNVVYYEKIETGEVD